MCVCIPWQTKTIENAREGRYGRFVTKTSSSSAAAPPPAAAATTEIPARRLTEFRC